MRFRLIITVVLLLGLGAGHVFAETISPKKAKEILLKAQKLQKTRTYTAKSISGKIKIKIYQRLNRDGTTYRRIEAKSKNKTNLSLVNTDGYFQISGYTPNIAIKYDFDRNSSKLNFGNNANYKGEHGLCDNIPCYIITQSIVLNEAFFRHFEKLTPKFLKEKTTKLQRKKRFYRSSPSTRIFYVGQKNDFIYKVLSYDRNGSLKSSLVRKNVNLMPKFDDNLFDLPFGVRIKIVHSVSDMINTSRKVLNSSIKKSIIRKKAKPSLVARTWNKIASVPSSIVYTVDNNFSSITSVLSTILFWSAILLFAVGAFFKWKGKRN